MRFADLMNNERELLLRSLAFCGMKVIVPISNNRGNFNMSELDLDNGEITEIHLNDVYFPSIEDSLNRIGFTKKGIINKWHIFVRSEQNLNVRGFTGAFEVGDIVIINTGLINDVSAGTKAIIIYTSKELVSLITQQGKTVTITGDRLQHESLIFLKKCNNIIFNVITRIKHIVANDFE